jgi:hypothetical protein
MHGAADPRLRTGTETLEVTKKKIKNDGGEDGDDVGVLMAARGLAAKDTSPAFKFPFPSPEISFSEGGR